MNETTLLARVQELLDARRDPFDDAEVVACLDAHPEWLPQLVALRADALALASLRPSRPPLAPPRRRWPRVGSAVFAAAAAALVTTLLPTPPPPPRAGRIVTAQFTELRARAHLAATFVVNDSLVATPTSRLQTWQTRSEPR